MSSASFLALRGTQQTFDALSAYRLSDSVITDAGQVTAVRVAAVSPSFFDVVQKEPALGRRFVTADEQVAVPRGTITGLGDVAILSHTLWTNRFRERPDVIGTFVTLEGRPVQIIGVMPRDFQFPAGVDVWLPLVLGDIAPLDWGGYYLSVVARLKSGVRLGLADRDAASRGHGECAIAGVAALLL